LGELSPQATERVFYTSYKLFFQAARFTEFREAILAISMVLFPHFPKIRQNFTLFSSFSKPKAGFYHLLFNKTSQNP